MKKFIAMASFIWGLICFPATGLAMYANFVSQLVPATMETGKTYSVSITMKNPNVSGWGQPGWEQALYWSEANKCRLGSQNPQDNIVWGVNRVYLGNSEVIKFNTNKTFTFNVTAPAIAGNYSFQWQMVQEGVKWFGDKTPNMAINVIASCVPATCASLGKNCGSWSNNCGGTINCGTCAAGQTCSNGKCVASCIPATCASLGKNCGSWSNNCGGTINCGTCAAGQTCSNGKCVASCIPATCASLGKNCGSWNNNCGGTINCGTCISGQICSNGQCVAQCVDECSSAGIKRCSGNGYQTCGNHDSDSCLEWSTVTLCAGENTCSLGNCLPASMKRCSSSNGYQFCNIYENGSCVEWSAVIACPSGQTCSDGICFACHPWTVSGCKVCNLSGTGWTDDNSKCLTGQTCSNGVCIVNDENINASGNNNINDNNNADIANNISVNLPTIDITVNGNSKEVMVNAGEVVALDWSATNADLCRASGDWSGNQPIKGSMRLTVINSKEYAIVCSNSSGSASKKVLVKIYVPTNNESATTAINNFNNINSDNAPMTHQQIIEKISELKSLIDALTKQLQAITGASNDFSCDQITDNLFYGMRGSDQVKCLQELLRSQGFAVVPTGDFGGITRTAVVQFQEKYAGEILTPVGLSRGSGYVGQLTLGKINQIIAAR